MLLRRIRLGGEGRSLEKSFEWIPGDVNAGFFTVVHRFAQEFCKNPLDALEEQDYFALQIEPGSIRG